MGTFNGTPCLHHFLLASRSLTWRCGVVSLIIFLLSESGCRVTGFRLVSCYFLSTSETYNCCSSWSLSFCRCSVARMYTTCVRRVALGVQEARPQGNEIRRRESMGDERIQSNAVSEDVHKYLPLLVKYRSVHDGSCRTGERREEEKVPDRIASQIKSGK